MNPWDKMTQSTHSRDNESFRLNYIKEFGFDADNITCACSGLKVEVTMTHLLPRSTGKSIYEIHGLTSDEMKSIRNLLILATNIEKAYDRQQISFIKKSIQKDDLVLKIWYRTIANTTISAGSAKTIGQ